MIKLRATKFHKELVVDENDLEWAVKEHEHYRIILTLHHIPSGERITQASDINQSEAKGHCLRELQHRLCSAPVEKRFCAYCKREITDGNMKRKYCGRPCQNVARKMRSKLQDMVTA